MTNDVRDRLSGLEAHRVESYDAIDLNRLALFALGWLRDERIPPTFENLVVVVFRMFPGKFALRGFDFPDANRVNRTLLQLGPKYRNWARGSYRTGYALTPSGEVVLKEARQRLDSPGELSSARSRVRAGGYTWDPTTDVVELRDTDAIRRFTSAGSQALDNEDVWNALNAFSYTPVDAVRSRLITLRDYASQVEDAEAVAFIDALRERFEAISGPSKRGGSRA
jgi:hypothetical protein